MSRLCGRLSHDSEDSEIPARLLNPTGISSNVRILTRFTVMTLTNRLPPRCVQILSSNWR